MTKMKTHKGCKKRIRVSAKGKMRYKKSFSGHLMSSKSGNRCRRLRQISSMTGGAAKRAALALKSSS
ncbi:MAG: 50S ribosomal protein L35 [Planctomycetota bacterium]|jgi:large subunit ribosomal protein L35